MEKSSTSVEGTSPRLRFFFVVIVATLLPLSTRAHSDSEPRQTAYLGVGVPIPLEIYGYDPSLEGSDASVEMLIAGQVAYGGALFRWPYLFLNVQAAIHYARVGDGSIQVSGYAVPLGIEAMIRMPLGRQGPQKWDLGVGLGPTLVFGGFRVDENMHRKTVAWGVQGHVLVNRIVISRLRLALDIACDYAFNPIKGDSFFNKELKNSATLTVTLGPMFIF